MRRPAPTKLEKLGWEKFGSGIHVDWRHASGWLLQHCGHPTANHPWALYDPERRMWTAGAAGPARNPLFGCAWDTVGEAFRFVAEVLADERLFAKCVANARRVGGGGRWTP